MSLDEIGATEEIMRLAINGQNHVDSLVGFYRDRIDKFNDQRMEWAMAYQECKVNASNDHFISSGIEAARMRTSDLEVQLSKIQAQLTSERQLYFLRLQQQEAVKIRAEENKTHYRNLMAVYRPISTSQKQDSRVSFTNKSIKQGKMHVNSKRTALELELINEEKGHAQKKNILQERITELKKQMDQLISEHSMRENSSQYRKAFDNLTETQAKLMGMTTEYFRLQLSGYEEQRQLHQQNQLLRLKNLSLMHKLKSLQQDFSEETKAVDTQVKKKNIQFKQKYNEELRRKEEHIGMLKQQHERINDIYLGRMKRMQSELRQTIDKCSSLEQRSKVQIGSLRSQIKILSNRLEKEGLRQMRRQLADGECEESSESLALSQLQDINRQVEELGRNL